MFRLFLFLAAVPLVALADERPNVLWITLEDTSPHFIGCYGSKDARTPHIDALAARGIRFDRAFANAPVCSAARSTIITGILNERLGTGNHRSSFPVPDRIKGFPTALRTAGYYTSNNKKTDYSTSASSASHGTNPPAGPGGGNARTDSPSSACSTSRTATSPAP